LFEINFRREAYVRSQARARRRVIMLGVWVAYFGALGVVTGLYALNCVSLTRRVAQLERQSDRLRRQQGAAAEWTVGQGDLGQVEEYVVGTRRLRTRLVRLAAILPENVRLTSIAVNPSNLTAPIERNRMVIEGVVLPESGEDRMQSVMRIVSTLHDDSLFAEGFQNVKLSTTRVSEGTGAEFVIECR
jgi:hypothetical protein